jgi:hypothetical protein
MLKKNNQAFFPLNLILLLVISNTIHSEIGGVCFEGFFSFFFEHNKRLEAQDTFNVFSPIEVQLIGNSFPLTLSELLFSYHWIGRVCHWIGQS